jgi:hypothetical protein
MINLFSRFFQETWDPVTVLKMSSIFFYNLEDVLPGLDDHQHDHWLTIGT